MKVLAVILIVVGVCWMVLCFLGVSMMSRSVNMLTEAVLPALLGFVPVAIGIYILSRRNPPSES